MIPSWAKKFLGINDSESKIEPTDENTELVFNKKMFLDLIPNWARKFLSFGDENDNIEQKKETPELSSTTHEFKIKHLEQTKQNEQRTNQDSNVINTTSVNNTNNKTVIPIDTSYNNPDPTLYDYPI